MIDEILIDCLEVAGQIERRAFIRQVSEEFDLDPKEADDTLTSLIRMGKVRIFVNKKNHAILELWESDRL